MNKTTSSSFFGEIIESTIDSFTAQSWIWDQIPNYGSLIEVTSNDFCIIGTVTHVNTQSQDPIRKPFAYQKTHAELLKEQPQIFAFLKTTFQVQILGYFENLNTNQQFLYLLPPQPSIIHSFVKECSRSRYEEILQNPSYLSMLFAFQTKITQLDELLLSLLRNFSKQKKLSQSIITDFCNAYSLHTGNDYKRLKLFLQRASSFIP